MDQKKYEFNDLMAFEKPAVTERVCYEYGLTEIESQELFRDLLKFFWFSVNVKDKSLASIDKPILIIDVMWHTFLLFTSEYEKFCMKFFGFYLHHNPNLDKNTNKSPLIIEDVTAEKRKKYEEIYKLLGEDTFKRWYIDFPEIYSIEKICSLRRDNLLQLKL